MSNARPGCYVIEGHSIALHWARHVGVVRLRRRSWVGRALRVPRLVLGHHRLGVPWVHAARLALVVLKP